MRVCVTLFVAFVVLLECVSGSGVSGNVPEWEYVGSTLLDPELYLSSSEGIASTAERLFFNGRQVMTATDTNYRIAAPGFQALSIPLQLREMGYDHLGDGDVYGDLLYQCLERQHYDTYTNATLLSYNVTTLEWTGQYAQTEQMHMPWVAVNSDTGDLYSSDWSPVDYVYVYDAATLVQKRLLPLSIEISEPQGGGFFEGLLYISCNDDNVYIFNPTTGENVGMFSSGFSAEMEGLTFLDLRSQGQGMLHILDGNVGTPWKGSNHMLYHYDFQ